ncbi:L-fucose mutarotase [uncultured Sphaerochaeta sp.]|jgi:L-fucose mutarotase|uniref:L-fucose mutarotase n=1 Tax=uncultured Sphaerochaeta sp. TaxID=886478 RepID=UPI0029C7C047|nr:L-fucose mutarotase [uncultured Sphaerochaeta sp.]
MLIGISPYIGPELLEALDRMGHGDEIVIVDAFYPGDTRSSRCIRADGIKAEDLLDGIFRLMNPDDYVKDPVVMMQPSEGDSADPAVEASFQAVLDKYWPDTPKIQKIERQEFYDRAKRAYAVVVSGSIVKYGCIIIRKGVLPH